MSRRNMFESENEETGRAVPGAYGQGGALIFFENVSDWCENYDMKQNGQKHTLKNLVNPSARLA